MSWHTISDRTVTTRKQYLCVWCGEIVERGSTVRCVTGKFDGVMQTNYWHPECDRAFVLVLQDDPYYGSDGFGFGEHDRPPRNESGN